MKIIILKERLKFVEDYSSFENDDVVAILSEVCKKIDSLKLAKIESLFAEHDQAFSNLDFSYDFTSIASELWDLIYWIEEGGGDEFSLYFYELSRKILLSFIDTSTIRYKIISDKNSEIIVENNIETVLLYRTIGTLLEDFTSLVKGYFPRAADTLIKEDFVLVT